ncbi:MAG: heme o synthase [bacterium]|nr:heme o synthase [bacterium]
MKPQADIGEVGYSLSRTRMMDYVTLTKPRISVFVALSTTVGFVLGSSGSVDLGRMMHTLLATLMVSAGSAALNQFIERDLDARMRRTANRPLPSGRLQPVEAFVFGLLLCAIGIFYLGLKVSWLVSLVAALTNFIYLFLYTPLKQKTAHNTAVGAVSGALPPVGGWAAAHGDLGIGAWVLFAIMFAWQFPHFFSIAWIYQEDYKQGGYRMLPVEDPSGNRTSHQVVLYSLVLLPLGLMPSLLQISGGVYFVFSVLLTLGLLFYSFAFARFRTERHARHLMRATLIYLPALWGMMILDKLAT